MKVNTINEIVNRFNSMMDYDAIQKTRISKEYNPRHFGIIGGDRIRGNMQREMEYELAHYLVENDLLFTEEIEMPNGNIRYSQTLYNIAPRPKKKP